MKRILTFVLVACQALFCLATTIPASDSRITYVGRTLAKDGNVSFDWSATYVKVKFTGKTLTLRATDTYKDFFNVWIDRVPAADPDFVLEMGTNDSTYVLYSQVKGKAKQHLIVIQKRTEGESRRTTFMEFSTDGTFEQAPGLVARQFEVVGDSYTCGYGSENSVRTDPFKAETENCSKTYAAILARYFGADYWTIAHSGMGIARNYNSKFPGWLMPDRYNQVFDMDSTIMWDSSKSALKPAITIIYLGTNDFSVGQQPRREEFIKHYMQLLREIKANYGEDHPILCVASKADELLFDYVRSAATRSYMNNVHYMGFFDNVHYDTNENLGASWHPNYYGHQKLAYAIIPYVATMTGWGIQETLVK